MIISWCKVGPVWTMLRNFLLVVFVRTLLSYSGTLFLPSLNNRHHFRTFPLFTAPLPHTSPFCPWISAGREFLVFESPITNRTWQVVGFSYFMVISDDCSAGEKLWHCSVQYTFPPWHREDEYSWQQCARHLRGRYTWSVSSFRAPLVCVKARHVTENLNYSGNTVFDSCPFESRSRHRMSWDFSSYTSVSLGKFRVLSQIRPRPLPSISFPIY